MTGLCPWFLRGDLVPLELPNSSVFAFHEPLRSHLSLCYKLRWLRLEASHQEDQPHDWFIGALRQVDLQGGRGRGKQGEWGVGDWVQSGTSDSINHAYEKRHPKNLWIAKLIGVSYLTNPSMCWEEVCMHRLHGERGALYVGPFHISLCLFI